MAKQKIALVAIAKNESRCIARMLTSVKPWVDEMIVVDTGSEDNTVKIAKKCGAKVSHFKWCDDFSAARNHALSMTKAAWRLILDADEYISKNGRVLPIIASEKPTAIGLLTVRSAFPVTLGEGRIGNIDTVDQLPRIIPRGIIYKGIVHEQPVMELPLFDSHLCVDHDGYETNQVKKKVGRNRVLLERTLENDPENAYFNFQYGRELHKDGDARGALELYVKSLEFLGDEERAWRRTAVISTITAAAHAKRFDIGFKCAEQNQDRYSDWPDFWFQYATFLLDLATYEPLIARSLMIEIEAALKQSISIGETPHISGSVPGRGSFLAEKNLKVLRSMP